ncbi:RNA polymerase sigma factor [Tahibacter soli]|uniref:Sigma-70 family RNA polymerase sigma factor n=1 Tax=Tahibacter soli TaxID=2983605 RepID=A0A9X4BH89_9GAMM|nr:sigma-70 family RNA polymerase sigma factor [Tahibacter soli]MDC8013830.1 sigma-70 family RNA polymerase sigma factor [Tahibacter soli]
MGDEKTWVEAARRGDRTAFRRLVDAHSRPLYGLCGRITRDPVLAEDAVQEALFNAWRNLAGFDGRASFATWLHRIAVNAALEQLRKRSGKELVATDAAPADDEDAAGDFLAARADETPGPDRHASGGEIRRRVETELGRMTALERSAFVLRHHEGQSLEEICGQLSINVSACKQAIFRAVRKLRGALEPLR